MNPVIPMRRAVPPIFKIRAALRERLAGAASCSSSFAKATEDRPANRQAVDPASPAVVSIVDPLMLGWAEEAVGAQRQVAQLLHGIEDELADLVALVRATVTAAAGSPLERLLVFTKLEAARGLTRQALNLAAACGLAAVLWVALAPADGQVWQRGARGARVVMALKVLRGMRRAQPLEGAA